MLKGLLCAALGVAAFGQTPAFEVASIKPSGPLNPELIKSGKQPVGLKIDAARVDIGFLSIKDLIRMAYRVKDYQISGPNWMSTERFDVHAKLPDGASSEQVPEMLQALLAERFKLTIHRETKEHSMYALVVGKNGSKLKESPPDDPPSGDGVPVGPGIGNGQVRMSGSMEGKGVVVSGGPNGTMRMQMGPEGTMRMETSKMTLAALAEVLSRFVDRPVVDMTELKGNYQMTLELSMDVLKNVARTAGVTIPTQPAGGDAGKAPAPADAASDPSGSSSIFASVQQMGLKLEARKAPVDLVVIDHLEKTPTEN